MVYHHLAKFSAHSYFCIRDMFLVYHMIKQDHIIKESGDYNGKSPLR